MLAPCNTLRLLASCISKFPKLSLNPEAMAVELLRVRHTSSFLVCAAAAKLVHPAKKRAGDLLALVAFQEVPWSRMVVLCVTRSSGNVLNRKASSAKEEDASPGQPGHVTRTGVLVHGCHLSADGWEHIVWGRPPHELGRLPHAVLLAWEEGCCIWGS